MPAQIASSTTPLPIHVVSDVVCPWCFIGKRRLEKALALVSDVPVQVHWRPYFLNPWVPREGMSRNDYLTTKFGSPERYKDIAKRVAAAAAEEGLVYAIDKVARQPNTLDCHRLILWAQGVTDPARMKQRLMELYFSEGGDLTDREVLVGAAAACGMDAETVRKQLASDEDAERVTRDAEAARDAGIEGVPTFIFANLLAVSGAQAPEYLAQAIRRAAQELERQAGAAATLG